MTNITLMERDSFYYVKAEGHSGYAESGADIVCAAISILLHSFSVTVADTANIVAYDGYTEISVKDADRAKYAAWDMLKSGLYALSENYSEYVSISGAKIKF